MKTNILNVVQCERRLILPMFIGQVFLQYQYDQPGEQHLDGKSPMGEMHGIPGVQQSQPLQMMNQMLPSLQMQYQQPPADVLQMHRSMGIMHPGNMPGPPMPPGMMQIPGGWNLPPGAGMQGPMMMMALHQVMQSGPQHLPGHQHPPMQPAFQSPHPHNHPNSHPHGMPASSSHHAGHPPQLMHPSFHRPPTMHAQSAHMHHPQSHHQGSRYHPSHHYGGPKGHAVQRKSQHHANIAMRAALGMRDEDIMRASSPMLTRILVDLLREGEEGNQRAWQFFERLCSLNKADVYQHSVMLNACSNSWAAEKLMQRMEQAHVKPSEVTYQVQNMLSSACLHCLVLTDVDGVCRNSTKFIFEMLASRRPSRYCRLSTEWQ